MKVFCACTSYIRQNCYLLIDENSGESALVDPGSYGVDLREMLNEHNIEKLKYILLTHGHFDHLLGVASAKRAYGGEVAIHENDKPCMLDAKMAEASHAFAKRFEAVQPDILLHDGSVLKLGETEIKVMHTPGHTVGSVCFIAGRDIFCGDTVFRGTVGRTDLRGGDHDELMKSIEKLASLEGNYTLYPGHDSLTTLNNERRSNPFFGAVR